jgi:hypothetical protein
MPDGSVVFWEYKKKDGTFDETTAKKENCPWFRPARQDMTRVA